MNCSVTGMQIAEIIRQLSAKHVNEVSTVVGQSAPDVKLCLVCFLASTAFAKICEVTPENSHTQIIDAMQDRLREGCCPTLCTPQVFDSELKMAYQEYLTAIFQPSTEAGPLYDIGKCFLWLAFQINTLDIFLMSRMSMTLGSYMVGLREGIDLVVAELK